MLPELKPLPKLMELAALETIVYNPLPTLLCVRFGAVAMALSVVVALIDIGPAYGVLEVVGVVPSVV
jgi:hypothetical protein